MINRILIVMLTTLFLAACGGGGGGGGGGSSSSDSDNSADNNSSPNNNDSGEQAGESEEFVQQQNSYLPLIDGAGWRFDGDVDMAASEESGSFENTSDPVFSITNSIGDLGSLTQYFTSTKAAVSLVELGGPIEFPVPNPLGGDDIDIEISKIELSDPIVVIGEGLAAESQLTANVSTNFGLFELDADVTVSNTPSMISVDLDGDLNVDPIVYPSMQTTVSIRLNDSVTILGFPVPVDVTLGETSQFLEGVGFVRREISFAGSEPVTFSAIDLINLPHPVIYNLVTGTPVLYENNSVNIDGINLSPANYDILDTENIDNNDWVGVAENVNGLSFDVTMSATESLPDETTSLVFYISETGDDAQIPVNVTLVVE